MPLLSSTTFAVLKQPIKFRLPARKKQPRTSSSSSSSHDTDRTAASLLLLLPVELLARILDFFHTKQVKLELATVHPLLTSAARMCRIHYPLGPSFGPLERLLRDMQVEQIGCLPSRRGVNTITKQQQLLNLSAASLEGMCVVQDDDQAGGMLLLRHRQMLTAASSPSSVEVVAQGGRWRVRGAGAALQPVEHVINVLMPRLEQAAGYAKALYSSSSSAAAVSPYQLMTADMAAINPAKSSFGESTSALPRFALPASVQVRVKVVDVELCPAETRKRTQPPPPQEEDVILATAEYVLERDDDVLQGGEWTFSRGLLVGDFARIVSRAQAQHISHVLQPGDRVPVGMVQPKLGRCIVYPGSHARRVGALTNTSRTRAARQRTLVLQLVDATAASPSKPFEMRNVIAPHRRQQARV